MGIHSKWTMHQASQSGVLSNKERLVKVQDSGQALLKAKPEMGDLVSPKLEDPGHPFDQLENDTQEKGERLFDAKGADPYDQSCDDIDSFTREVEVSQIETELIEELEDLTSVNIMMQKQQLIETKMLVKGDQADKLGKEEVEEIRMRKTKVDEKVAFASSQEVGN